MKRFLISVGAVLTAFPVFSQSGIIDALKNPPMVTTLSFSGEKNESPLFVKNVSRFSSLTTVVIDGADDSVVIERDLSAIAACPSVTKVVLKNLSVQHISGVVQMLTGVKEIAIENCNQLDNDQAFAVFAAMPKLQVFSFRSAKISNLPLSLKYMRGLNSVRVRNDDLSLADGYALNHNLPAQLFSEDSLVLGFGSTALVLTYGCYDEAMAKLHLGVMRDILQGALGESGEMQLPARAKAFTRINPLVKPPIQGLDVQKNIYTADATAGAVIDYPSGTQIFVPANAFVDANGNVLHGTVTLDYREFRDQADIIASGIPMTYDSAGIKRNFVSAGMFELNASVNGQEVFLAPGKRVNMNFAVVDTTSAYNFYSLDDKGWHFISPNGKVDNVIPPKKDDLQADSTNDNTMTDAIISFRSHVGMFTIKHQRPYLGDTTSFDRVYNDTNWFYTMQFRAGKRDTFNEGYKYKISTRWRVNHVYSEKGTNCFTLKRFFGNDYRGVNPEVGAFSSITWQFNDKIAKAELAALRSMHSGISDVRFSYEGGSEFTMQLKFPNGFRTYSVTAVKMNGKHPMVCDELKCSHMNDLYKRQFNRRRNQYTTRITRRVNALSKWNQLATADSISDWNEVKNEMNKKEKTMLFNQWTAYYNKTLAANLIRAQGDGSFSFIQVTEGTIGRGNAQAAVFYQALQLSNFGTFNCDGYPPLQSPAVINAKISTPTDENIHPTNIYVINKNLNTSVNFFSWNSGPVQIKYSSTAKNCLLALDANGRIYFTDEDAFAKGQRSGDNTRYNSTLVTDKPATPQQLRNLLTLPSKDSVQ